MSSATGVEVTQDEARRIAVRAQLLDGSATDVLDTVRRLGFLQLDPISAVAQPQHLVLWSRLGPVDRLELDRLLWDERKLFEWNAFIWPIEDLPLIQARMRARWGHYKRERWAMQFLKEQSSLRRYVLRELERRGPLLSRELEHPDTRASERYVWWGTRAQLTWMLELLHLRGRIAVAGRRGNQRLWDLADRWYPETETVPAAEAKRALAEKRFRSLGVRLEKGRWLANPDADARPVGRRITFLSPFDRLIHDRDRAEALWDFRYRLEMYVPKAKREYGYYVLPILRGDDIVGRIEPVFDRKAGILRVNGVWWQPGSREVSLDRPLAQLARFVGANSITGGGT
ncbi:MAG: DNA glycosylase AlkZ-like family protein [Gaiellaceae bacterium]